jgi:hypothetical protein
LAIAAVNGASLNEEIRAKMNLAENLRDAVGIAPPNQANPSPPDTPINYPPLSFAYPGEQRCPLTNFADGSLGSGGVVADVDSVQDCLRFCAAQDGSFCKYISYNPTTKSCAMHTACTPSAGAGFVSHRMGTSGPCDYQPSTVVLQGGAAFNDPTHGSGEVGCRNFCKASTNQYCSYFGVQNKVGGAVCIFYSNRATWSAKNCATTPLNTPETATSLQTYPRYSNEVPLPPIEPKVVGPVCVQYTYQNGDYSKQPNTVFMWPSNVGPVADEADCIAKCQAKGDCKGIIYNLLSNQCGFYNNRSPLSTHLCDQRVDASVFTGDALARLIAEFGQDISFKTTIIRNSSGPVPPYSYP